MTKALAIFYMVALLATRASAFSPATLRGQSVLDSTKTARPNTPLFMSDDDVSVEILSQGQNTTDRQRTVFSHAYFC